MHPIRLAIPRFVLVLSLSLIAANSTASAQIVSVGFRYSCWQGTTNPLAEQINAQASFQRALGESAVNFSTARKINAETFRQQLDNSVAYVQAGWDKKAIYRAEMFKRYIAPLDQQRLKMSKQWDWIEKDPNFAPEAIQNGRAMNVLLDRLAVTVLAYSYTTTHTQDDNELRKRLKLEPEVIHQLFLKESVGRAGLRFRADSREALAIDWWPWLFREQKSLQKARQEFDAARESLVNHLADNGITQRLQTLLDKYWQLKTDLDRWFEDHKRDPGFVAQGHPTHYVDCKRFLESLFGEIHRLQRTGSSSMLMGRVKFEGNNLLDLIAFMSKSALKFDTAQPGEEAAYHQVFQMMRDLYITVDDAWIKDGGEIKTIEEKRHK